MTSMLASSLDFFLMVCIIAVGIQQVKQKEGGYCIHYSTIPMFY